MGLGLVAFGNDGGLGAQTRRLSKFLNPDKILLVDTTGFSPNKKFHPEWYPAEKTTITKGFPSGREVLRFLDGLTHVFMCEDPYNPFLIKAARDLGIKTICQVNYEFMQNLRDPSLPLPDIIVMPSYWKLEETMVLYGPSRVYYLPPPIDPNEFAAVRVKNMERMGKMRFLHVVGTLATHDRNGTLDLLGCLDQAHSDFELVVASQHVLPEKYFTKDPRVTYSICNKLDNASLYEDFDAMILPRRYGGLSLTMMEALMSGLPVIMPDISPNNGVLPSDWLVPAKKIGEFMATSMIDIYGTSRSALAKKMDDWCTFSPDKELTQKVAFQFSTDFLRPDYNALLL